MFGLPMLLVLLTATFAAIPEQYRPASVNRFFAGYPIRIDLEAVSEMTAQRDRARQTARAVDVAAQDPSLAEMISLNPLLAPPSEADVPLANAALSEGPGAVTSPEADGIGRSAPRVAGVSGILAIDFDLEGGPQSASTLEVSKDLQREGQVVGQIAIRVDNNSAIYVARADLVRLVPTAPAEVQALGDEFVPLATLRSSGVNLRYDPISDRLVLID